MKKEKEKYGGYEEAVTIAVFKATNREEYIDKIKEYHYAELPEFEGKETDVGYWCNNCFPENTKVLTPTGFKKIKEIKIGDEVVGYQEGKLVVTKVLAIGQREASKTSLIKIKVEINTSKNKEGHFFVATDEHPFYEAKKGWTKAIDLKEGDELFFLPKNQVLSLHKKYWNPMKNPDIAKKVMAQLKYLREQGLIKHVLSDEGRAKISQMMKINNPMFNKEIALRNNRQRNHKEMGKISWRNREDKKMSKPEKIVLELAESYKLPIWYCGMGNYWVENMNPDFKVHQQKKVIEIWQHGYLGRDENWAKARKEQWRQKGYECLMLDVPTYITDERKTELLQKIQTFISNGLPIKEIIRYNKEGSIIVYNLQTETENYFIKSTNATPYVLVHNCEYFIKSKDSPTGYWCRAIKIPDRPHGCCSLHDLKPELREFEIEE